MLQQIDIENSEEKRSTMYFKLGEMTGERLWYKLQNKVSLRPGNRTQHFQNWEEEMKDMRRVLVPDAFDPRILALVKLEMEKRIRDHDYHETTREFKGHVSIKRTNFQTTIRSGEFPVRNCPVLSGWIATMRSKTGGERKKYLDVALIETNKESHGLPDPGLHQDFNEEYIKSSTFGEADWPITYYIPLEGRGIHLKVHDTKGTRGPRNKPRLMWIPVNSVLMFDPTWFLHGTVPWDGKQPFPPRRLNVQNYGVEEMLM